MSPPLYQIRNWDEIYETAETRKLKALHWAPIPNKHDGLGYRRVVAQRNACELFAAWILLVQIASKGRKGERGRIQRDGRALDAEDLSLMTGFPKEVFIRALEFFSDPKQGWLILLEVPGDISANPAAATHVVEGAPDVPASPPDTSGRSAATAGNAPAEWKEGKEGMEGHLAPADKPPDAVRIPKKEKSAKPQDVCFDALAIAEGSDPKQLTAPAARKVAVALALIRQVTPDVGPTEIARRASVYRRKMPGAELTAHALAGHWARLDGNAEGRARGAQAPKIPPEPAGWSGKLARTMSGNGAGWRRVDGAGEAVVDRAGCMYRWHELPDSVRGDLLTAKPEVATA